MAASNSALITLDRVSAVGSGGQEVVRDLTWTVADGETWAIIGPVGSGKTSLAEVLRGRHRVTSGTISWPLLDRLNVGWPTDAIPLVSFRENSQLFSPARHYYQQRFNFIEPQDDLTLERYLRTETHADVAPIAGRLGLTELLPLSFIALSTGQMRRARIARALLARPEIMILDDPFLGLDAAGRSEIAALLGELIRDGARLLLITRPDTIPDWVTHVLELEHSAPIRQGRRVSTASPYTLTTAHAGQPSPGIEHYSADIVVELRNVNVAYGNRSALCDVSWTVRSGERWAVTGPNGSGKTTLLSLLCGDHPQAYANDVRIFGRRRGSGESIWDLKRAIGLVSSELHLYYAEPLTAMQAGATGFHDVLAYRRPKPAQAAAVRHLFAQFGILPLADRRFDYLSTGEQRLVLLIRALVKRPPLLILDEPFQGMDRPTMEGARDWLDGNLRPDQTLIVVTHDPAELPRTVRHHLELNNGRTQQPV